MNELRKKILVVSAHPEPRSLNAALAAFAVELLDLFAVYGTVDLPKERCAAA
jgi:hypothetical protein